MDENRQPPPPGSEPPRRYFDDAPVEPHQYNDVGFTGKPSGGVMALAIITIVVTSLGILFSCCGLGSLVMMPLFGKMPIPAEQSAMYQQMGEDTFVMVNGAVTSLVWIVLFVLGLVGGIGILKLKAWGRRLCFGYSIGVLLFWVLSTVVNLVFIQPRMAEIMQGMPGAELQKSTLMQIGGAGLGFMCYDILPIVLLIVLTRPGVKDQFRRAQDLRTG